MPYVVSKPATVLIDVAAWGTIHAATGYLVHRMSAARFESDWWVHRQRSFERDGRFYVHVLRIKRWKGLLPEAGALFAGGFDKKHLRSRDGEYLRRYAMETRRAELGHWLAAAAAPLFFLWNPWPAGIVMVVYAIAANGPCIAATRYNRLRIIRMLGDNR